MKLQISSPRAIGIDTVILRVPYHGDRLHTQYTQRLTPDGEVIQMGSYAVCIKGKARQHTVKVRHDQQRNELQIEGSPYGFLYGQNVFTGTDLPWITRHLLKKVAEKLSLPETQVAQWSEDQIVVDRIDLAMNLNFGSKEDVNSALVQLGQQFAAHQRSMFMQATSLYWNPRLGKDYLIALYAKGAQLEAKYNRSQTKDPILKRLLEETVGMLRIELRLRGPELKQLHMTRVNDWTRQSMANAFCRYFARMPVWNVTSGPLTLDELEGLSPAEKRYLALHKSGAPMSWLQTERSTQRLRKSFREKHHLDLRCPNRDERTMKLADLMSDPDRIVKTPQWLIEAGWARSTRKASSSQSVGTRPKKVGDHRAASLSTTQCSSIPV